MQISNSQERALNAVEDLIKGQTSELFSHNIMILIYGILNVELKKDLTAIPKLPNDGNDKIQINIPDWVKSVPTPPFTPGDYQSPQVWYDTTGNPPRMFTEKEKLTPICQTSEFVTTVGVEDGPVVTTTVTGTKTDFRDEQTSFNDK